MVWEAPGAEQGAWDNFEARKLGMAVARRTRTRHGGHADAARQAAARRVAKALGMAAEAATTAADLALVVDLIPDLERWSAPEKKLCRDWLRAKSAAEEAGYLRLLAKNQRLRRALIRLGS
jgi:hypothetical protein